MNLEIPHNCQISCLSEVYQKYLDLDNKENRLFVEVGAFDGVNFSNTFPLSKLGWNGVYIEPVPDFAKACLQNHSFNKNVNVVCCAVGNVEGTSEIAVAGTLSTMSQENLDAYSKIDWANNHLMSTYSGNIQVPVRRLDTLLRNLNVKDIDVLVVDVEGSEEVVFKSFSFNEYKPKLIICEIEDDHKDLSKFTSIKNSSERVRNHIVSSGYVEVFRDEINTIFVDKERV